MTLSTRAEEYLKKQRRSGPCFVDDVGLIMTYLERNCLPCFQPIVDFQTAYSGYDLTVFGDSGSTFSACLFLKEDLVSNGKLEDIEVDGKHYFYCGDHATAQFWFVLSESGELCTYDNAAYSVNQICSSFGQFVEDYAIRDGLVKYFKSPYYELSDAAVFEQKMESFEQMMDANDNRLAWYSQDNVSVVKGTWLDRQSSYIQILGASLEIRDTVIGQLRTAGAIS